MLTQDGCECQAAQDERDYPPQIASLLHLSLQKHAEKDTSVSSGRRRRAPTVAAAREVAARGPNPVGSQLGQLVFAFKSNWSRWFKYVFSVRSKTCRVLPTFEAVGLENITYT